MKEQLPFTRLETALLVAVALVGFAVLNVAFVYGLVHGDALLVALRNPVALAFVIEAALLVPVLAWLFARGQLTRLHWTWFVALALIGGLAFALPVALLWRGGGPGARNSDSPAARLGDGLAS